MRLVSLGAIRPSGSVLSGDGPSASNACAELHGDDSNLAAAMLDLRTNFSKMDAGS